MLRAPATSRVAPAQGRQPCPGVGMSSGGAGPAFSHSSSASCNEGAPNGQSLPPPLRLLDEQPTWCLICQDKPCFLPALAQALLQHKRSQSNSSQHLLLRDPARASGYAPISSSAHHVTATMEHADNRVQHSAQPCHMGAGMRGGLGCYSSE